MILFIQGAPGVGKTTLAHSLLEHFRDSVVIEVDHIRQALPENDWTDDWQHTEAIQQALVGALERQGRDLVMLVDTFYQGKIVAPVDVMKEEGVTHRVVSLVANREALQARMARMDRRDHGFTDIDAAVEVNADIWEFRCDSEICIHTGDLDADQVFNMVAGMLERGFGLIPKTACLTSEAPE